MRPHNRAIQQEPFAVGLIRTVVESLLPDPFIAPAGEAFENAIPLAVGFGQQPPLGAAAGDPQHGFDKAAGFRLIANINAGAGFEEGINRLPVRIR